MKKIASVAGWMAALMVACCPCTAEMSVQDGHVYGQKEIDGKRIVYDFDVPEEVESVKQYRTEAVRMKLGWVEQILKPYVQKPRSGDAWDLINDRQWNDINFCYFEQNGRYACEGGSYIGPRKKSDDRDIQAASDVVLALLKEMNLSDFEYPFYTATSQCKSIETAIEPISSEEEYIRVKALPDSTVREYYEKEALGKERNLIVVRFLMDDIRFASAIRSRTRKKAIWMRWSARQESLCSTRTTKSSAPKSESMFTRLAKRENAKRFCLGGHA